MVSPPTTELELSIQPHMESAGESLSLTDIEGRILLKESIPPFDIEAFQSSYLDLLVHYVTQAVPDRLLEEMGRYLFSRLFPGALALKFLESLDICADTNSQIRINLNIQSPRLRNIPIEYLRFPDGDANRFGEKFLALNQRIHLVHRRNASHVLAPLPVNPLKVLIVSANPKSSAYPDLINLESERRSVVAALRDPSCRRIEVKELRFTTRQNLEQTIDSEKPHVLHFMGHGDQRPTGGVLILEGVGGEDTLYGDDLAQWLNAAGTRLVMLAACHTSSGMRGVAQTISEKGLPAVIAMQLPMRDSAAGLFARAFYTSLAEPCSVEDALWQGRQSVRGMGPDWGVPVLHLNVRDSNLFILGNSADEILPPTNLPYIRNKDFAGRQIELAALHQTLMGNGSGSAAIAGMAGLGKTQLAVEYAHKHRMEYTGGVFWLNARGTARLTEEYAALGALFNIPDDLSVEKRARRTRDHLQCLSLPSLVIYDNLDAGTDPSLLLTAGNYSAIITTRSRFLIPAGYSIQEIGDLDDDSAIRLLDPQGMSVSREECKAATEIIEILGRLPLALALVGHHVRRLHITFADYRDRLSRNLSDILGEARKRWVNTTCHSGEIFDVIELTYRSLVPGVRYVLEIASCFGSRGISVPILQRACDSLPEIEYKEALADLEDYSLVIREKEDRISIHELVRAFAHVEMSPSSLSSYIEKSSMVLTEALRAANESKSWNEFRSEVAHCRVSADLCRRNGLKAQLYQMLIELGTYNLEHCDHAQAMELYREAHEISDQEWGRISYQTASVLRCLAECIQESDPVQARSYAEEALDISFQVYPPDHIEIATFHSTLGYVLKMHGMKSENDELLNEARPHYDKALEITLQCYGRQHRKVASCLNYIGMWLKCKHKLDEALTYLQEALEIDQKVFGMHNVQVAIRQNNIGTTYGEKGDWAEALKRHEKALNIYRKTYGERRHQDTADSLFYLAKALAALDRVEEAIVRLNEALPHYDFIYGENGYYSSTTRSLIHELKNN